MITREQIPAVLDHPVYGADGKIGNAQHVFLDDATGQPEWATVKTGMLGGGESFVPLRDATVIEDHLEVPFARDKVKDAPRVNIEAGRHLSAEDEHRLFDYYGLDWGTAWHQEGGETSGTGTAAGAAAGTAAGTAGAATEKTGTGTRRGRDAMTRSEERMHVRTERQETGRARLRKYVVTEEEEQTVPLHREEVRVVREPITEANRDEATSGPEITEDEYEVRVYEERPVVETRVEPVERIRLATEEFVENETVRGTVRKERVEADLPEEEPER